MDEAQHPLKRWRQDRSMGQVELGERVGVSASQISQIESGQKGASLEVALKIQKLAGQAVPLECLLPSKESAA